MAHSTTTRFDDGLQRLLASPPKVGAVEMIVRRPGLGQREVLDQATLVVGHGLIGDNYIERGNRHTPDNAAHPEAQLNIMNVHAVDTCAAGDRSRWPLAGDQFFVDFDLSLTNAPPGTHLAIGTAVIEVSAKPHTGCAKFRDRFGVDAARWVNSSLEHRIRGLNAMVIVDGLVRTGDTIRMQPR